MRKPKIILGERVGNGPLVWNTTKKRARKARMRVFPASSVEPIIVPPPPKSIFG